jgi:hypothetical protein
MKQSVAAERQRYSENERIRQALEKCQQRAVVQVEPEPDATLQLRVEALEGTVVVLRQEIERLREAR